MISRIKQKDIIKIIYHPDFEIDYPTASCEKPERVTSIMSSLKNDFDIMKPVSCTEDDILLCHIRELINMEKQNSERFNVACLSAGGAILSSELALKGFIPFAVIRPPGHHANRDRNWGFCFLNNIAIAIKKLIKNK